MAWYDRIASLAGLKAARKKRPAGASGGPPWYFSSPTGTPLVGGWTESRIEQVRHFKHWVYVAVRQIANQVAQTRPCVSVCRDTTRPDASGDPDRYLSARLRQKALVPLQTHEELEPVASDHPLNRLLTDANVYDTGFDLWYETVLYLSLTGSAYWWAPKNRAGLPMELWCIPSHWVWPLPGRAGQRVIESYQVRPAEGVYTGVNLPADDVIHFRYKSPVSKIDGYAPLSAGSQWVDAAESVDRTRWHSFRNGPMPQLKVEFQEMNPSPELIDRIEARIQSRYAGEHNAAKPMLVPKGASVEPLWLSPRELDFGKSFDQMREAILSLFGVPGVVAGITKNMTYGSVLAAQAGFCQFTVNPLLAFLGQTITERLARQFDEKLRVWWPDQAPEDPTYRIRHLDLQARYGAITKDELRATDGRKPIDGGDVLIPTAVEVSALQDPSSPASKALRREWRRARRSL